MAKEPQYPYLDALRPGPTADDRRFRLVEIAFKRFIGHGQPTRTAEEIGTRCAKYADAALAAMETMSPVDREWDEAHRARRAAIEQTPDTGPPAEEIERRARALAGNLLTDMEVWRGPVLANLRDEIQAQLDADLKVHANSPTTNIRVGGYRDGSCDARRSTLALIDAAIEKAGAEENDNAK